MPWVVIWLALGLEQAECPREEARSRRRRLRRTWWCLAGVRFIRLMQGWLPRQVMLARVQ